MASFHRLPIPDLLRDARDLYTNARDDDEIFALLSAEPWGFTEADFDAGLALVQAVTTALGTEAREELEARQATTAYDAAADAVRAAYNLHRDLLRSRYDRDAPEYSGLGLAGETPGDREDLLKDAADFYGTLSSQTDIVAAVRGLSAETVAEAQGLVEAARDDGSAQTKEAGDAERARATQQAAVRALREHAALTAKDAAAALKDHPQLRERLGLRERS